MLKEIVVAVLMINCGAMALPVEDQELTFELAGVTHYESRKVADNIVTLTDFQDHFVVTLDYGRDILLINNLESQACFFSRLENVPISVDDPTPVLVVGASEEADLDKNEQGVGEFVFTLGGSIPFNYVSLTNDVTVAEQCISKPSYWLDPKISERKRRSASCGVVCVIAVWEVGKWIG